MTKEEWLDDIRKSDINLPTKAFLLGLYPLLDVDSRIRRLLLGEESLVSEESSSPDTREVG